MICPICKNGKFISGYTTITFERESATIILKKVPASICDNCEESFVSEKVSKKLFKIINAEFKKGIEVEVINYAA